MEAENYEELFCGAPGIGICILCIFEDRREEPECLNLIIDISPLNLLKYIGKKPSRLGNRSSWILIYGGRKVRTPSRGESQGIKK
jgi:hypothetical protein